MQPPVEMGILRVMGDDDRHSVVGDLGLVVECAWSGGVRGSLPGNLDDGIGVASLDDCSVWSSCRCGYGSSVCPSEAGVTVGTGSPVCSLCSDGDGRT